MENDGEWNCRVQAAVERCERLLGRLLDEGGLREGTLEEVRDRRRELSALMPVLGGGIVDVVKRDILVLGIEVTQGTQFYNFGGEGSGLHRANSVKLVANRDLVLRVYCSSSYTSPSWLVSALPKITGDVLVQRVLLDGSLVSQRVLSPINEAGYILDQMPESISREERDDTLNFLLPAAECYGTVRFLVRVYDPSRGIGIVNAWMRAAGSTRRTSGGLGLPAGLDAHSLADALDDARTEVTTSPPLSSRKAHVASFELLPTVPFHVVLIRNRSQDQDIPAPTVARFWEYFQYLRRVFPVGKVTLEFSEVEFADDVDTHDLDGIHELLLMLGNMSAAGDPNVLYLGMIQSANDHSPQGAAWSGEDLQWTQFGIAAVSTPTPEVTPNLFGENVIAHEVGHAFDRQHAPHGIVSDPDPDYPPYNGVDEGRIGEVGFDAATNRVYARDASYDYMGRPGYYVKSPWTSPYTYKALIQALRAIETPGGPLGPDSVNDEILYLRIRIDTSGSVRFLPGFHLPGALVPDGRSLGADVWCDLVDENGRTISKSRMSCIRRMCDADGDAGLYAAAIAWHDHARTITVRRRDGASETMDIEGAGPKVSLAVPDIDVLVDPVRVTWTATHPGQDIRCMLRYSHDGGRSWRVLVPNAGTQGADVDPRGLHGGRQCLFQVVASSGIRTAVAESEPFAVPERPREVHILSPKPSSMCAEGEVLQLEGIGISPTHGLADAVETVWTSSLDGTLGAGQSLSHVALSPGVHRVTLTVPDGTGCEVSASVTVRVRQRE